MNYSFNPFTDRYTIPVICLAALFILGAVSGYIGEDQQTNDVFTETGITSARVEDGSEWIFLRPGSWACFIWADVRTNASVDVETLVTGTTVTPTKVSDVDIPKLVGATTDIWGTLNGNGYFRIEVEGDDTINWQCRRFSS